MNAASRLTLARCANLRVDRVSPNESPEGETQATMYVSELPPSESWSPIRTAPRQGTERVSGHSAHPQKERELGVAVGDMAVVATADVDQRHDDVAERRQRLVDLGRLVEAGAV